MPIILLELLFYFIILLADQDTLKNKILKLVPFTALGVVSGMVFMNGQHGVRYFIHIPGAFITDANGLDRRQSQSASFHLRRWRITSPTLIIWIGRTFEMVSDQAVYSPQTLALLLGGFLLYIASVLLIVSIPLMAMKNKIGLVHCHRHRAGYRCCQFPGLHRAPVPPSGCKADLLSSVLLAILLIPAFKQFLIEKGE